MDKVTYNLCSCVKEPCNLKTFLKFEEFYSLMTLLRFEGCATWIRLNFKSFISWKFRSNLRSFNSWRFCSNLRSCFFILKTFLKFEELCNLNTPLQFEELSIWRCSLNFNSFMTCSLGLCNKEHRNLHFKPVFWGNLTWRSGLNLTNSVTWSGFSNLKSFETLTI